MEQTDANDPDEAADARLRCQLQQLQSASPAGLEQATRQQIGQYLRQRRIGQATGMLICFLAVVGAIRWLVPNDDKLPSVVQQAQSVPLDDRELAALFSPPVDQLSLLDRQQQVSFQALKQWERNR